MNPAAYAMLDLPALHHNLQVVRRHAPQAKVMAVIKANGYGHGMVRVAETLAQAGVDAFAVARVQEGIRLRKAGLLTRIAVLEGFTCAEELADLLAYQLDAVVHGAHQLPLLAQQPGQATIAAWLKMDTGMNRLGFAPSEFAAAYEQLRRCPVVRQPISLMTHLANADAPDDPVTVKQIRWFQTTVAGLPGERSIANSAGILAWQEAHSDWVRPGVMLYGIAPFPNQHGAALGLKPLMGLHSRLIAVKPLAKGDTVGYGCHWVCPQDTVLGVVAIGYGDGYPRYAKPGTPVLVNGQRVPLIGRVSMDMITVDLAALPTAKPGDAVTLWGDGLAVEEIALWADTIPYTLVCGVTQRVRLVEV